MTPFLVFVLLFYCFLLIFIFYSYFYQYLIFQKINTKIHSKKVKKFSHTSSQKEWSLLTLVWWFMKTGGSTAKALVMIRKAATVAEFRLSKAGLAVISDLTLGKELFQKRAFSCRPESSFFSFLCQDSGIALNSGQNWKDQRKFCHQNLKHFGFGTKSMEALIQQEIHDFLDTWSAKNGERFSPNRVFNVPVLSSLWVLLVGERIPTQDTKIMTILLGFFAGFRKLINLPEFTLLTFPLKLSTVNFISQWIRIFPGIIEANKYVPLYRSHFRPIINDRNKTVSDIDAPTNLLDLYLLKLRHTTQELSNFFGTKGDNNLTQVILDFIIAGGDTTANTLAWAMLHLIRNPAIQERIRDEIDVAIGKEPHPCLQDIPNCPYTYAFILELMRFSPVAAASLPHTVLEDTTVGPYFFRKNTHIFLNIYGIHHDPSIWGDPENFRPERFLSDDGKSVVKHEALCGFSVGLRRCVGEQVAYDNLFLFISSICHRFVLKYDPLLNNRPPLEDEKTGLFVPKPFHMVAIDRFK